jgi:hypothetical protein
MVKATIAWTSKNATETWILGSTIANPGADPKTDGGLGPLPPNGSKTVDFDCANDAYYYNVTVYNTGNNTHSGQVSQVPRS